jgi:hypothetical protein
MTLTNNNYFTHIQSFALAGTGWTAAKSLSHNRPMWRDFKIEKLSDEFGQYSILISCACGHTRRCDPRTLAAIVGWDARLEEVAKRMRCSKCRARACELKALALTKPRGYTSH